MTRLARLLLSPPARRVLGSTYLEVMRQLKREVVSQLRREFPPDFDEQLVTTIRRVSHASITGPARLAAVCQAVEYVVRCDVPGAVVECGVWKGGSMMAAAITLGRLQAARDLYLFDTFDGMTEPTELDISHDGRTAADEQAALDLIRVPLEQVERNMASTGYDPALVHYVRGPGEETLPGGAPERIALLRLDTDWYESTRHEMETLYPRLSVGGVLIIDDYGHWQGARTAVDEYLAKNGISIFLNRIDYTGRLAIKTAALPGER